MARPEICEHRLTGALDETEFLYGARRAQVTATLQRLRFGTEVTLETTGGKHRGRLHGCDGVHVALLDGTSLPVRDVRLVMAR